MITTGSPKPEGSDKMAGLGFFVSELLTTRPPGLLLSSPPLSCSGMLKLMLIRCSRQESTDRRPELHTSKVLGIRACL